MRLLSRQDERAGLQQGAGFEPRSRLALAFTFSFALTSALSFALTLLPASARAESAQSDRADAMLRSSGLQAQLIELSQLVVRSVSVSPLYRHVSRAEMQTLQTQVEQAFSPARLHAVVRADLAQALEPAETQAALNWYGSATGQLISGLEQSASGALGNARESMLEAERAYANATAARQALLAKWVDNSRAAHKAVDHNIEFTVGIFAGIVGATPQRSTLSGPQLRSRLEQQRPRMLEAARVAALALAAASYSTLSDAELETYLAFLSSAAGLSTTQKMTDALTRSLVAASADFAQRMAQRARLNAAPG